MPYVEEGARVRGLDGSLLQHRLSCTSKNSKWEQDNARICRSDYAARNCYAELRGSSLVECELCERIEAIARLYACGRDGFDTRPRKLGRYSTNEDSRWSSASASECIETIARSLRKRW